MLGRSLTVAANISYIYLLVLHYQLYLVGFTYVMIMLLHICHDHVIAHMS